MALSTYNEIKETLEGVLETLKDSVYPDDYVREFADSAVPIYYGEIINEWTQLSGEYSDRWKVDHYYGDRITDLMAYDLAIYYSDKYFQAWHEIKEELEIE